MISPVFHILVFGFNKFNSKDISASTQYRGVHLVMTAIAENLFQSKGYGCLVIYAGVEDRQALIERFRIYAPRTPIFIFADSPEENLLTGDTFVWYADPSDRKKFLFSLSALWNFLETFLAQKSGLEGEGEYIIGGGRLSFRKGTYHKGGEKYPLTVKQLELMKILVEHRGEVVSRAQLMKEIWLKEKFVGDRIIDTNIVALRKLFNSRGRNEGVLQTCHGLGYCLAFENEHSDNKDSI